jgi:hypothetical protein
VPTDRSRLAAVAACLATALALGGCADDATPGATPDVTSGVTSEDTPAASAPSTGADDGGSTASGATSQQRSTGKASKPSSSSDTSPGSDGADGNGGGSDPSGTVLEVPVAPEPIVDSLGDLLGDADRPLVATPLPRAASARGRLVGGFPAALRPAPRSRVETSSVSPADDRLQVALVGTTTLAPARVLLDYRARLGRRGLVEQATTPPTAAGSQAAALQRGRSTVTITVTRQGSRTTYSVIASLHTGRE